jgi:hypothetical protein
VGRSPYATTSVEERPRHRRHPDVVRAHARHPRIPSQGQDLPSAARPTTATEAVGSIAVLSQARPAWRSPDGCPTRSRSRLQRAGQGPRFARTRWCRGPSTWRTRSGGEAGAVDMSRWTDQERRAISGHRWWPLSDLTSTDETAYPDGLGDLVRSRPRGLRRYGRPSVSSPAPSLHQGTAERGTPTTVAAWLCAGGGTWATPRRRPKRGLRSGWKPPAVLESLRAGQGPE